MKAIVVHDEQGAIQSVALLGGASKLQVQLVAEPGTSVAEVELPVKVAKDDLHKAKLHQRLREVLDGYKVIGGKLVRTSKR